MPYPLYPTPYPGVWPGYGFAYSPYNVPPYGMSPSMLPSMPPFGSLTLKHHLWFLQHLRQCQPLLLHHQQHLCLHQLPLKTQLPHQLWLMRREQIKALKAMIAK